MKARLFIVAVCLAVVAAGCGNGDQAIPTPNTTTNTIKSPPAQCQPNEDEAGAPEGFSSVGTFTLDSSGGVVAATGEGVIFENGQSRSTVRWSGDIGVEIGPGPEGTVAILTTGVPISLLFPHPDDDQLFCYTAAIGSGESLSVSAMRTISATSKFEVFAA